MDTSSIFTCLRDPFLEGETILDHTFLRCQSVSSQGCRSAYDAPILVLEGAIHRYAVKLSAVFQNHPSIECGHLKFWLKYRYVIIWDQAFDCKMYIEVSVRHECSAVIVPLSWHPLWPRLQIGILNPFMLTKEFLKGDWTGICAREISSTLSG